MKPTSPRTSTSAPKKTFQCRNHSSMPVHPIRREPVRHLLLTDSGINTQSREEIDSRSSESIGTCRAAFRSHRSSGRHCSGRPAAPGLPGRCRDSDSFRSRPGTSRGIPIRRSVPIAPARLAARGRDRGHSPAGAQGGKSVPISPASASMRCRPTWKTPHQARPLHEGRRRELAVWCVIANPSTGVRSDSLGFRKTRISSERSFLFRSEFHAWEKSIR